MPGNPAIRCFQIPESAYSFSILPIPFSGKVFLLPGSHDFQARLDKNLIANYFLIYLYIYLIIMILKITFITNMIKK